MEERIKKRKKQTWKERERERERSAVVLCSSALFFSFATALLCTPPCPQIPPKFKIPYFQKKTKFPLFLSSSSFFFFSLDRRILSLSRRRFAALLCKLCDF
ncbi:hypothetical protein P3X46_033677 [Hevea brasiliensis]|uniref:Transmembrane protein n=1 Tax=Hevea brasiliensis TaxID=3981 RepID=A0ABQ9KC12_HEVBR|nr:hypothetical protein P3X46_033677 [Hevea brasiliensis]